MQRDVAFHEATEGGHGVSDAIRNRQPMALRVSFLIDTLMKNLSIGNALVIQMGHLRLSEM